jgi:hypothetical protein
MKEPAGSVHVHVRRRGEEVHESDPAALGDRRERCGIDDGGHAVKRLAQTGACRKIAASPFDSWVAAGQPGQYTYAFSASQKLAHDVTAEMAGTARDENARFISAGLLNHVSFPQQWLIEVGYTSRRPSAIRLIDQDV